MNVADPNQANAAAVPSRNLIVRDAERGEALWFLDNLFVVKASGRDGAPFSLLEGRFPAGSSTPLHRHSGEDEAFYVLEGEVTFYSEGSPPHRAGPGSYVHLPEGLAHGFRTETAVRMLVITGPAGFVEFSRAAGAPAPRLELPPSPENVDVGALARIAGANGVQVLGPLPE